jgi:hypothetical protein
VELAPTTPIGGETDPGDRLQLVLRHDLLRARLRLAYLAPVDRCPSAPGVDDAAARNGWSRKRYKNEDGDAPEHDPHLVAVRL